VKARVINPRVVVDVKQSGKVYGCACGRSTPIETAKTNGWRRAVALGCLIWWCPVCLPADVRAKLGKRP